MPYQSILRQPPKSWGALHYPNLPREKFPDPAWLKDCELSVRMFYRGPMRGKYPVPGKAEWYPKTIEIHSVQFGTGWPKVDLETGEKVYTGYFGERGPYLDLKDLHEVDLKLLHEGHISDRLKAAIAKQFPIHRVTKADVQEMRQREKEYREWRKHAREGDE